MNYMQEKICKNCEFNEGIYGTDNWTTGNVRLIICNRFIPHISNCKVSGNPNQKNLEVIIRKKEIQTHIHNKEPKDLPYLLVSDNFGCNQFKEKNEK